MNRATYMAGRSLLLGVWAVLGHSVGLVCRFCSGISLGSSTGPTLILPLGHLCTGQSESGQPGHSLLGTGNWKCVFLLREVISLGSTSAILFAWAQHTQLLPPPEKKVRAFCSPLFPQQAV